MQILSKTSNNQMAYSTETNQRIYDFLKTHPIGVIATVDPNGNPHAAVMYFSVDDEFTVGFMTKRGTKKYDNLKHNNHAMVIFYEAFTQTTCQITGKVNEIKDEVESNKVYKKMVQISEQTSDAGIPPISKLFAGDYVAYQLVPKQIRMAMFIRPDSGGYDIYETIDF